MVVAMARNVAGPDVVLIGGLTALMALGIVDVPDALRGFASPAVMTVAVLFVVAAAMRETGALDLLARRVLGRPRLVATAQVRLMIPVVGMSAFLNNTPIVAMMVPLVLDWSRRTGIAASKLLIPLSYAALLGGVCTLIGTSTNLVVAGMAATLETPILIGMFDIAPLGVPVAIAGLVYVVIASRFLLPDTRGTPRSVDNPREYTVAMRVASDSPIVGQTIEEAGLRHLPGLYLVEIEREGDVMAAVGPEVRIRAEDLLLFAGIVDSVVDLRRIRGLVPATDQVHKLEARPDRCLVEAVVASGSPLAGRNVRDTQFRTRYKAAIIAVHRQGERVRAKVGDIVLQAGDVLLLETHARFVDERRHDGDFALVSAVEGSAPPRHHKAGLATVILLAMVAVVVGGVLDLLIAALIAAALLIVTGCVDGENARRSIEVRVLVAIAAAFGVGAALSASGAADALGGGLVRAAMPLGPIGVVAAIYVATTVLTELITNNAAAALMFPIAISAAEQSRLPIEPVLLALMVAASASFSTPIGYQTNLMVYGPGGYRFADFLRFGVPLQIVVMAVTIAFVAIWWL